MACIRTWFILLSVILVSQMCWLMMVL
ncbi:hypothetical protein F383_33953 [Gossypium arboreum]|uniref:Uncharacterized protein n=1 Tax=Gossypium arboreum TaxID=29729 RepID=A0A0B0MYI5_GOSAR|nr:hypothetical protein F383_33953 [Gossypium arboreum]